MAWLLYLSKNHFTSTESHTLRPVLQAGRTSARPSTFCWIWSWRGWKGASTSPGSRTGPCGPTDPPTRICLRGPIEANVHVRRIIFCCCCCCCTSLFHYKSGGGEKEDFQVKQSGSFITLSSKTLTPTLSVRFSPQSRVLHVHGHWRAESAVVSVPFSQYINLIIECGVFIFLYKS